jgi:hypothetical protein
MLRTILGLHADAPHKRLFVNPTRPDWKSDIELQHMQVGPCKVTIHFWRQGDSSCWEVRELSSEKNVKQEDMIEVVQELGS